jgi:hypothetical protein
VPAICRPQQAAGAQSPAAIRLLEYLGLGATVELTPGGAIVIQADHTTEAIRLEDLALAA